MGRPTGAAARAPGRGARPFPPLPSNQSPEPRQPIDPYAIPRSRDSRRVLPPWMWLACSYMFFNKLWYVPHLSDIRAGHVRAAFEVPRRAVGDISAYLAELEPERITDGPGHRALRAVRGADPARLRRSGPPDPRVAAVRRVEERRPPLRGVVGGQSDRNGARRGIATLETAERLQSLPRRPRRCEAGSCRPRRCARSRRRRWTVRQRSSSSSRPPRRAREGPQGPVPAGPGCRPARLRSRERPVRGGPQRAGSSGTGATPTGRSAGSSSSRPTPGRGCCRRSRSAPTSCSTGEESGES